MPFSPEVREEALVRSRRFCCVCHLHAGRNAVVHHIEQEANGGANTLENAIALCPKCHAEAGHYNPRHPLGTKYSPSELRRHRDDWWAYCEQYQDAKRPRDHVEPAGSGCGIPRQRRDVGTLWSDRADINASKETLEFEARLLAATRFENVSVVRKSELFQRGDGRFFVYVCTVHRLDWCDAHLHGAPPEETPLTLDQVHERFPELATEAGLQRVRRL